MAAVSRSHPQPLVAQTLITTRKKYQFVRIKEMLSHALGGSCGGGLFSTGPTTPTAARNIFDPVENTVLQSQVATSIPPSEASPDTARKAPGPPNNRKSSVPAG